MKKFPTLLLMNVFLFTGLVGYSFIRAYNEGPWLVPADAPPISNMATPINVGVQTQSKSGNLAANIFAAFTQMRSNFYCDALGNNCTAASDLGDNGSGVQLSGGAGILLNPNVIT